MNPPVGLVLDASAAVAYTRSSVAVGEILIEVGDDPAVAALPVACLVAAVPLVDDISHLQLLADHWAVLVVGEDPASWQALAAMQDIVGSYEAAVAALMALDAGIPLLSGRPRLYAGLGGDLVIPIDE